MKVKTRKISLITLILALVISLASLLGVSIIKANAAGTVAVNGSNVFTATGDANVLADRQEFDPEEGGTEKVVKYYTMFSFAYNADAVSYRKNLAYNWYEAGENGEGLNKLFNTEIGFKSTAFERFVIKFESQLYEKTDKETKSVNYVIFYPVEGEADKVYVKITTDGDEKLGDGTHTAIDKDHIVIKFTQKLASGYAVSVAAGGVEVTGEFKNVGGNYSKSSTSTSSPVYPLTFKSEFKDSEESQTAQMVLYSLNGQVFEVTGVSHNEEKDYYYGGTVTDNTPPVLCLEDEIRYFTLGGEIDVEYAVIDVLRSSPRATLNYYVLTYDQYKNYKSGETDYNDKELFTEVDTNKDYLLVSGKDKYLPETEAANTVFAADGKLAADMAVKAYMKLTDVTTNGESADVYLDWYLADDYKLKINNSDFIAVANDKQGVSFNYGGEWENLKAEYQALVTERAKNLSAGSSSYLYLPSPEKLFKDNATAYSDLKVSVYYYNTTQQSNTGLATNNLSINTAKQGDYTFTFYATDAAGNDMYYIDGDGEVKEFGSGEIWNMFKDEDKEGLYDKLPWFNFSVGYTGVQFEETPGMQSTAYVGTSYSSGSFKINGISGSYNTVYRLFLFDRAGYYNDHGTTLSYEKFVEFMDELYDGAETQKYFKEIPSLDGLEETDPEYEEYKDYGWKSNSTSFTPQDSNAFYVIRAEVTDTQYNTDPVACNMAVVASVQAKSLKGESDWLKNNVASVVLLCIAGVALICIVLLLVIKPKNEGDADAQYEKVKNAKKSKKQ